MGEMMNRTAIALIATITCALVSLLLPLSPAPALAEPILDQLVAPCTDTTKIPKTIVGIESCFTRLEFDLMTVETQLPRDKWGLLHNRLLERDGVVRDTLYTFLHGSDMMIDDDGCTDARAKDRPHECSDLFDVLAEDIAVAAREVQVLEREAQAQSDLGDRSLASYVSAIARAKATLDQIADSADWAVDGFLRDTPEYERRMPRTHLVALTMLADRLPGTIPASHRGDIDDKLEPIEIDIDALESECQEIDVRRDLEPCHHRLTRLETGLVEAYAALLTLVRDHAPAPEEEPTPDTSAEAVAAADPPTDPPADPPEEPSH